jgi:hypothetical protein
MRNEYIILARKCDRERPIGILTHRWEDIRMDLRRIGWKSMDWIKYYSI